MLNILPLCLRMAFIIQIYDLLHVILWDVWSGIITVCKIEHVHTPEKIICFIYNVLYIFNESLSYINCIRKIKCKVLGEIFMKYWERFDWYESGGRESPLSKNLTFNILTKQSNYLS